MAEALVTLFNQALGQAGTTKAIALPGEKSFRNETCELWYDRARTTVFSAAHWPECRGGFRLNVLAEKDDSVAWKLGDPQPGWRYAYGLPADHIHPRWINDMQFFELSSYTDVAQESQPAIVANTSNVVLTYTRDEKDLTKWSPTLYQAVMLALSAMICYPLTRKLNKANDLLQRANDAIGQARAVYNNAQEYEQERLAPWIAARNSAYQPIEYSQFIYPIGPLLSLQGTINT